MGMDVNNSRLSGMEQMAQASQPKRTDGAGNQPPASDVDEFEQLMKGESPATTNDKGTLKEGRSAADANSPLKEGRSAADANSPLKEGRSAADANSPLKEGRSTADANSPMKEGLSQASESKMPSADNFFASMFGMQNQQAPGQATGQAASVEVAGPISDPDAMDSMVNKMVDRILVSDPAKGQQEVRLTFNDAALKGTEVTLSRATDGQLMVKLDTTDKASYQTLVGAQDSLRAALERTGQNVRVEASLSSEQQDNNSNQRSKGYQEYKEDDADRRS